MNKEIIKRIDGWDIKITVQDNNIYITDRKNDFSCRFRSDDIDNFITWLNSALISYDSLSRCLDLNKRFFKYPMYTFGNYIDRNRIQVIKDILESMGGNKLYETVLDIKDDTKLLKDILNHASLWELDDIYSRIKVKKGELQ